MHFRKTLNQASACLIVTLLFFSCNRNRQAVDIEMPPLYPPPVSVKLNTDEGYILNPIRGVSIEPVFNTFGDTLITGRPVPARPKVIDPGIVAKAEVVKAENSTMLPENYMVSGKKFNPWDTIVNKENLRTFTTGKDSSSFILINSLRDTLPTGVPILIEGRVEPCRQPQPFRALPPRMMENARLNLRYIDEYNGMGSSDVIRMIEDSRGYLWFGHQAGVSRYDGNTFAHFTFEHGLKTNSVRSLLEDSRGNIWFGTQYTGVIKYDGHEFTCFSEKEGMSNNKITSIYEDRDGHIWFSTWGGGVSRYDGQTITHYTVKEGLSSNIVYSILEDDAGIFWFGTIGGGVCMFDGETFTHFTKKDGLGDNIVIFIQQDSHGNLWFPNNAGVSKYDGTSFHNYNKEETGLHDVRTVTEDSQGNFWFGCEMGAGVFKFDGQTIRHITEDDGLSNCRVWTILEDSNNNLWFSTLGGGVNVHKDASFQHFIHKRYTYDRDVKSIGVDKDNTIWLNGNNYFNGESFVDFSGNLENKRLALHDRSGNRWYYIPNRGVRMHNGETLTWFKESSGLLHADIKSIIEDSRGNIWMIFMNSLGLGVNVSMYDGQTFTHFTEKRGISSNRVNCVMEDRHGNIWFCYEGYGVSKYDRTSFTHYTEKEGLSDNYVNTMMEDSDGKLWFGTKTGGVSVFDGLTFTYITEREGLSNNEVRSIIEDREKRIWIGTRKGLNCLVFNPDSTSNRFTHQYPVIHTFGKLDGLNGINFNQQQALLDSNNRIWWYTDECVSMLNLENFTLPDVPTSFLHLDHIKINGAYLDFRNLPDSLASKVTFDSVCRFQNYPMNLKLAYRYNHLTFNYSAIDWEAPHKIRYSYIMEGLDKSWSNPSPEPMADYRNIPRGSYTFHIRAIGAAQEWSRSFRYSFTVRPPWWYSWWAWIIYGIMLILIIDQYRRYLLRRAKLKSAVEIERIEKEKVLELDQMKSRFFANISHEFRTPLTLILGPVEGWLRTRKDKLVIERDEASVIRRNAKRLHQLINQILDISKLETGKMKIQVSSGNLEEFVRTIILSFLSLAESRKIKYSFDLPGTDQEVYYDEDKVEKILTNLLSNAFKFTSPQGEVKVSYQLIDREGKESASHALIIVRDSGMGISQDKLERIFERYYQENDSDTRTAEGTGIGLSLTKELVDLYRGEISVDSEPGKGSTFELRIPVSMETFAEEEIVPVAPERDIREKTEDHKTDPEESGEYYIEESEIEEYSQGDQAKGNPNVLIVEDNIDLRNYIFRILGDDYEIDMAENGQKGLEHAIENIPDLVISDVMMPVMDGVEMCRQLKTDERTNHIPVIMLTAKSDQDSKMEGLETGADDYIIKPFDTEELQVRVRNLIEQRKNLREKFRKEFASLALKDGELPTEDKVLNSVIDSFHKHIDDPDFTMEDLGSELHMSRAQVFRKVSAVSGSTPNELLRTIRMNKAASLLQTGNDNISQIMYQVGYKSTSHFANAFKQVFGLNPSEFKNQK